jgi:hypothetical protein
MMTLKNQKQGGLHVTSKQKAINYIDSQFQAGMTYRSNTVDLILDNIERNSHSFRRRALIPTDTWRRVISEYRVDARRAYPNRLTTEDGQPFDSNRRQ